MPRVTPITAKNDVPAEHHAVVDAVMKTFGRIRGPYSMLLHTPLLAKHFLGVVDFMRGESIVEQKVRSLAALTAASERGGYYVWSAQVESALKAGVRKEAIELIRAKGDPSKLPDDERQIVAFAQQLMRTSNVDRPTFDTLHKRHGTKWMVELTAMTGYFGALCNIVTTFEVPVPEGGDKLR
ncbi:MAG TPA: carboxymuconolactone decarboxylase family protein [Burkholderiales bacterium]|nr:carboxymuconolactone decarboxylase family protein [Burkholderiales bacterium]